MTSKIEGHPAEQTYILSAVDGHTFVVDMSAPFQASVSRFNLNAFSGATSASYGCSLDDRTVTFSTYPATGGTVILTVRGRA